MIEVKNLSKSFNKNIILKDLSFSIKEGEVVVILGPSGSGKSTLIRCLNLLEIPEQGFLKIGDATISFTGNKLTSNIELKNIRAHTGMVFQSFNLFPHFTALKNIIIGLKTAKKISKNQAKEIALTYLNKVGLLYHIDKYPNQLSGGQQQRVAIARALSLNPNVLLLDEPTSALDPELVHEVLATIRDIATEKKTLVIVTHELAFAKEIADRIMFIDQGEIIEFTDTHTFFNKSKNPRILNFMSQLSFQ